MKTFDGADIGVSVFDNTGTIDSARAATAAELRSIEPELTGLLAAAPEADGTNLIVAWIGGRCDLTVTVSLEDTHLLVAPGPHPACDASAVGRAVVLAFHQSIPVNLDTRFIPGKVF
jgi:hypothetical protein